MPKATTLVSFLFAVICCRSAVGADGPRLELAASTGAIQFQYTAADETKKSVRIGPMVIDGADVVDLEQVEGADDTWQAGDVRLTLEQVDERAAAIRWTCTGGKSRRMTVKIHGNHASFGGGERFNTLNLQGHVLDLVSTDHPEPKGGISYKPVPFYMSSAGYAVWMDSFLPGRFDFNATDRFAVTLDYVGDELRIVLIDGPTFGGMLDTFTRLGGRPRVPPAWAFGLWKSRDVHRNRDDVLEDVEMLRKHDIPASVLVIDSPWETAYNDFEMNRDQFTEAEALFARVRELGFNTCFWMTPFINVVNVQDMKGIDAGPTSTFAEAAKHGYLVTGSDGEPVITDWWKGKGALIDFTNPDAVKWWQGQLRKTREWGGRAFKCDDGEGNFIGSARFADGSSAAKMTNRYSMLYLKATREYLDQALDGDGVIVGRSGFSGMHQYAMGWAGDNAADWSHENGLPGVILAAQSAALSGMPYWGSDIAGYMGQPTKELFIRWTQFGCFSPQMMVHMTSNLGPWDFDEPTLAIFRNYAKLHTRLFPYIYRTAQESAATGMPIIRPMVLAFQDEPAAWTHVFQFMFGPDFLVAPMYTPGTHRSVYLPNGKWIDYWTGALYAGKQNIEVEAQLERIPLFVRSGAVIEVLPADVDTLIVRHDDMAEDVVAIDDRRVIQVWPGESGAVDSGDGITATMKRTKGGGRMDIQCEPPRSLTVLLMHVRAGNVARTGSIPFGVKQESDPVATLVRFDDPIELVTLTWTD